MTPARLLLDEMLSPKIGAGLADRGYDVDAVTQRPDLMALHDDEPILAAATAEGRIMVTTNIGDFALLDSRWAAEARTHAGIVFVTTSAFPQDRGFIGSVVNALHAVAPKKRCRVMARPCTCVRPANGGRTSIPTGSQSYSVTSASVGMSSLMRWASSTRRQIS